MIAGKSAVLEHLDPRLRGDDRGAGVTGGVRMTKVEVTFIRY
jgi:hypothetical protein